MNQTIRDLDYWYSLLEYFELRLEQALTLKAQKYFSGEITRIKNTIAEIIREDKNGCKIKNRLL